MLTDSQIRGAKSSDRPRRLFDGRGLYLHLIPNGGRYWRFNYRFRGKQKTLALGTYPDVPLVRARERHFEALQLLAEGIDPGAAKQTVSKDFEAVARAWFVHWKGGRNSRYARYVMTRLEADVFPDTDRVARSEVLTRLGARHVGSSLVTAPAKRSCAGAACASSLLAGAP